jgi:hypothetical protein
VVLLVVPLLPRFTVCRPSLHSTLHTAHSRQHWMAAVSKPKLQLLTYDAWTCDGGHAAV